MKAFFVCRCGTLLMIAVLTISSGVMAAALPEAKVPESLKPWIPWVLYDHAADPCPVIYNDLSRHICAWPSSLNIAFREQQAVFSQKWTIYREKTRVTLPGSRDLWPQQVTVNDKPHPVCNRDKRPWVLIESPGEITVQGQLRYDRIPEKIQVPVQTGLVNLSVAGKQIVFPRLDKKGQLWVRADQAPPASKSTENRLRMKVHRLIKDDIPARVVTRLQLDVSGRHRREEIGQAYTDQFVPVRLDSPLPARIQKDGTLVLQVRPGTWTVELTLRHKGRLEALGLSDIGRLAGVDQEVWSFQPFNHLRMVDIKGPPRIDPSRTTMPGNWKSFPAYQMQPGQEMVFQVKKRGDPHPAPDHLTLDRTLWLDFDGGGFSLADAISGTMTSGWRLSMKSPITLGRVTINGRQRFITRLAGSDKAGVEMRHGQVDLKAQARIDQSGRLPATGWDKDFQAVQGRLNLPPGWSLFSTSGIDNIRDTWLKQWRLLDIFLVLVISLAAARLQGVQWGGVALLTLVLIKHEPGAPVWVWLHLLAAVALWRVIPSPRWRGIANSYRLACLVFLVVVGLPFMADQAKEGIYPQLEKPWMQMPAEQGQTRTVTAAADLREQRRLKSKRPSETVSDALVQSEKMAASPRAGRMKHYDEYQTPIKQGDTSAKIQTGPGIPDWRWNTVSFSWNGPVASDQAISFTFIPPAVNLVLAFVRIVLLALLIWGLSGINYVRGSGLDWSRLKPGAFGVLIFLAGLLAGSPRAVAAEKVFPPDRLLNDLKTRLIEKQKPECAPDCAFIPRMAAELSKDRLSIRLELHSLYDSVAVPLPADAEQWLPSRVTRDGQPVPGLYRDPRAGRIWIQAPKGVHQVILSGPLPNRNTVQLPLPLPPGRVAVMASGWQVDGLRDNGIPENQLQFTRLQTDQPGEKTRDTFDPERLPPLLEITRTFHLGLQWRVDTVVKRVSPTGFAVVTSVPLLEAEAVMTDLPVTEGRVRINLGPEQQTVRWRSSLSFQNQLQLTAPETLEWTEVWKINVGPLWHARLEGIPVIHHQGGSGTWLPEFRPWPGETLKIHITRPQGVAGQTHTIEKSRLDLTLGKRLTNADLKLHITSSRGGQHEIQLPDQAQLQSARINGQSQPLRQQGRVVTLPLTPGEQTIQLNWHERRRIDWCWQTSRVDLSMPSVDAVVTAKAPADRWVLFCGGPYVGPAVLFWSAVLVIILLSAGLARVKMVPLRFHHWVLLGIGLIQASLLTALPVVAWLLALGARKQYGQKQSDPVFNAIQVLLPLLTLAAVAALFFGIQHGLLGYPDMQIAGNGSHNHFLRWYQDITGNLLPTAYVISVPILVYRLLILAWALWIAFAFIKWLRWGFECYGSGGFWRPVNLRRWGKFTGRQAKSEPRDEA